MNRSAKRCMMIALTLVFCLLFTACSSNTSSNSAADSGLNSVADENAQGGESNKAEPQTRVFKDYKGREVTIPTHPKRIVVNQFMGHLLAVGVKPIGATESQTSQFEKSSFLKPLGLSEGVEVVGDNAISPEKALSLNPDLIIIQDNSVADVENLDKLSSIAPTVVLSFGSKPVFDLLRDIADIVGETDKAEAWIAAYEKKGEQYREQLAEVVPPNTTFTVIEVWPKSTIMLFGNLWGRGTFNIYNTLGLKAPPKVQDAVIDKEPSNLNVSLEVLPDYIGDYVFLTVYDYQDGDNDKLKKELDETPVWRNLPAVKENHVIQVDVDDYLPGDPLSLERQMDEQVKLLLEKFGK